MASTPTTPDHAPPSPDFAGFGLPSAPAFEDDAAPEAPAARLLLFGVNGRVCACEIEEVREIIPFRRITRLPGAPAYVLGLLNLRGSVITVLDLGTRLGGEPVDRSLGSIVLAEAGTRVVGLAVSDVRDVLPLAAGALEAPRGSDEGGIMRGLAHVVVDGESNGARDGEGSVVVLLNVQEIITQALL